MMKGEPVVMSAKGKMHQQQMDEDEDGNEQEQEDVKLNIVQPGIGVNFENDEDEIFDDEGQPEDEEQLDEGGEGNDEEVSSTIDANKIARNQCHICYSQFPLEKTYVEHMYNVHGVQRPFRCQDCGKCLSYRSSLYNHRKIHSNKRPWACQWCSAKFIWSNRYVINYAINYKCELIDAKRPIV